MATAALKFREEKDARLFLVDASRLDLMETPVEDIPDDVYELFLSKRKGLVLGMKDFRKSQITKAEWRKHRWRYLRGIRKFHRSIAGKRFHRSIGRFLASRIFDPKNQTALQILRAEALKGVSSVRTHLYIDTQYFKPLEEEVEYLTLLEFLIPKLTEIEMLFFKQDFELLTEDHLEILIRCVDARELSKCLVSCLGDRLEDYDQKRFALDESEGWGDTLAQLTLLNQFREQLP